MADQHGDVGWAGSPMTEESDAERMPLRRGSMSSAALSLHEP